MAKPCWAPLSPAWLRDELTTTPEPNKSLLDLPNGIPSHDTFRRVVMLIDPDAFEAGFTAWVGSLADRFEREVVAMTARPSGARSTMGVTRCRCTW